MKIQKLLNWLKQDTIAVDGKFIELDICVYEDDLEQQLQQARKDGKAEGIRLGWEQAKREAIEIMKYTDEVTIDWEETFDKSLDAIASMEYKEAQDGQL